MICPNVFVIGRVSHLPSVVTAVGRAGCSVTGKAIFLNTSNALVHSSLSVTDEQLNVRITSSPTSNCGGEEGEGEGEGEGRGKRSEGRKGRRGEGGRQVNPIYRLEFQN